MGKLVILKLDGDFWQQGFWVSVEIGSEGKLPEVEMTGYLPPAPELATHLQHHWHDTYRSLGAPYRLEPRKITIVGSINECKESARELEEHLRTWLDSEYFRPLYRRLLAELNRDEKIRVLIRTKDQQLQKLPWHLWELFELYPQAEFALSSTRFICQSKTKANSRTKVRILAILGHSQGINIAQDRQLLEKLPHAEIVFLVEPQQHQINEQLWEKSWDIIFFAGHSETEGEKGRIYLNQTDSLTLDELAFAFKKAVQKGLQLAIFNSCDGLGLAKQLGDLAIPQMIVMRELIPDKIAHEFLKYFLTAFASGTSCYLAAREARERLQGWEHKFPCASWLPVIYQNLAQEPFRWPEELLPWWKSLQTIRLKKLLLTSIAVTSLVIGARSLGLLQLAELKTFDQLMQLQPEEGVDERLLLVGVTKEDIQNLGHEYPLQDKTLLQLLQKLQQHQPRAIGLDIYRDHPEGKGYQDLVNYLKENEHVVPVCVYPFDEHDDGIAPPQGLPAQQPGFAEVLIDPDGTTRRHLLAMEAPAASDCATYYSFSLQLAHHYLEPEGVSLQFISEDHWQLGSVDLKQSPAHRWYYHRQLRVPGFQIMLNYRTNKYPQQVAEQVSLNDILTNRVKADFIKDKIILIGMTDSMIKDDFTTPYNQEIRGLELHAQMVSQLLSAVEDQRPLLWFLPFWSDTLWLCFFSLVGGIIGYRFQSPLSLGIAAGVSIIGNSAFCWICLLTTGCLLPLVPSVLTLVTTGGVLAGCKGKNHQ